ncbi:hypothetical protein R6Q57_011100 [Mikania cordata]
MMICPSIMYHMKIKDESISNHMKLKSYYDKKVTPNRSIQPPEDEGTCSDNAIKVERPEMTILDTVGDIIEAHSPSVYTGPPPHYQEDILHRRHYLEEEILQLSVESCSVASLDTSTSGSGDEHVEVGSHMHYESTTVDLSRTKSMDSLFFSCEDLQKTMENGSCTLKFGDSEQVGNNSYEGHLHDGEIVGLMKQEANWLDQKMCKRKPKTRIVSLTEKTAQTDNNNDSRKFNYSTHDAHEEASISDYHMLVEVNGIHSIDTGEILPGQILSSPGTGEFISKNLKVDLADFGIEETCRQDMSCYCLLEDPSGYSKSGMALLLSCEQKLYVVLFNGRHDGSGSSPSLVGCLGTEDVKEVLVGLGLQAVRVYAKRGARYMFITRSIEKSKMLISMLEFFHSNDKKKGFPLISLDKIQVALFERDVCGGSKTNILQYSMVLFSSNNSRDDQWFFRSLFVLGGHMLLCIEDISQFGFDSQDIFTPYFSLDTCCFIASALEMALHAGAGPASPLKIRYVS